MLISFLNRKNLAICYQHDLFLSSIGTVFAFVSNEKLNNSIENFNSTVNTAIDNSLDFVTDAQIVSSV